MTSVTVSDTQFNITVSDTANTVTVGTGGDVNVTVNQQTLSTAVSNVGGGAQVLKSITGDTLIARTIVANTEGDIVVTQNANDIDLALSDAIEVNSVALNGTSGDVLNQTQAGATARFAGTVVAGTLQASNIDGASTIDGTGNITITPGSSNFVHANTQLSVGNTATPQSVEITGTTIGKSSGSATDITFTGNHSGNLTAATTNISGHLIPVTDDTHDLGSTTKRFRDLYLGPGSLFVNNQKVLEDDSGEIKISSTNNLSIQSGGALTIDNTGNTTTINDTAINLGPSQSGATVRIRGTLESPDTHVGDLELGAQLINQTTTNGNLEIRTNGAGFTHINTADLYVGPLSGAVKIDENSIGVTAGTLTVTGNLTGSVTGQVSDISNHLLDEDNFASDSATKAPSQQSTKAYIASQISTKDNTDEITEGSSNLYFTNERVDDRVNALLQAGSNITLTYDDASNTLTIAATDTEDNLSNNDTDDLAEGSSNQYFTTARARASISASGSLAYNSSTGALTYTQGNTDTVAEGSSNLYHTTARAIAAVEGESTLALSGAVTTTGQLTVNDIIKVDDGFTLTAFNPYGAGNNMPTRIMGVGEEGGWAGVHVRNRGQHDFGLGSSFNFSPRAIMAMSAGRKDGSNNDDYLDSGDEFGVLTFNPFSGYKTGAEWLTGSAEISALATENHSATGLGTKLRLRTTENGEEAGSSESTHTNKFIDIHGHTITTDGTLKIDDDLIITGSISNDTSNTPVTVGDNLKVNGATSNNTEIGDNTITAANFNIHGLKVQADDTKWGAVLIKEFVGGANKPAVSGFSNPTFGTELVGGTPSSPAAVGSGKRTFVLQSIAANESDGTLPTTAGAMVKFETTEAQTTSAMGHKVAIESIANGATTRSSSIIAQGGNITLHAEGDATVSTGGDLILDDDVAITGGLDARGAISNSTGDVTINDNLKVNTNLTVDGNTQLGNANTDTATATAKHIAQNGFNNTVLNTSTANAILGMGIVSAGDQAYISDGNNGSPCMAFSDGSNWKKMHSPGDNISSS